MRNVLLALIVILVLAGLAGGCVYNGYNQAIALDEVVKQQWSEVDNQLQRRFDLIGQLVNTVKGVAGQEQKVFLGIAKSREAYNSAKTVPEKEQAAGQVEANYRQLLAVFENYPQLRSSESFLKLHDSIEGTENRLAVARQRYNDSVQRLDVFARQFPTMFYARIAGVEKPSYFKPKAAGVEEAPKVDFSDTTGGSG